jgi:hypothetical protein
LLACGTTMPDTYSADAAAPPPGVSAATSVTSPLLFIPFWSGAWLDIATAVSGFSPERARSPTCSTATADAAGPTYRRRAPPVPAPCVVCALCWGSGTNCPLGMCERWLGLKVAYPDLRSCRPSILPSPRYASSCLPLSLIYWWPPRPIPGCCAILMLESILTWFGPAVPESACLPCDC